MNEIRIFPVIMAGGASSRLWPASGREKPKWDLRLFGPQSLLEGAWERARAVAPAGDSFVVAGTAQAELIRRSLPELPAANLLVEPEPRDTSGAVAYAAGAILRASDSSGGRGDQQPVMFVLPGDHIISPVARFSECARAGARAAADSRALVTFGILPRSPATGYGYVHRGAELAGGDARPTSPKVYRVLEFREKPDRATAEKYVAGGEYYWNGGIFLWHIDTLMAEFERQLPAHAAMARDLGRCASQADWDAAARRHFPGLKKISIDFGIMEHAQAPVAAVAADFAWDDIGSWSAVAAHLGQGEGLGGAGEASGGARVPARGSGNAVGPGTDVIEIDARGNVVYAPGKRVALVGVEGLAVIESGGEILVCRLERDQDVKKASEAAARAPRGAAG